jgi:hypothetical protein
LNLQSSIVTGVIAERRDVVKVPLVFLAEEEVFEGSEHASLAACNHILFSILEDAVIQAELLWIKIVVVSAEVVLLATLNRVVEDQGRSNYTLRRCTNIASCGETSFNVAASAVTCMRRLTEIPRWAAPGIVLWKRTCGCIRRVGNKG